MLLQLQQIINIITESMQATCLLTLVEIVLANIGCTSCKQEMSDTTESD